jgi:hypothetical protein
MARTAEITFGNEPFTLKNLLRYNTFQLQDSVPVRHKSLLHLGGNFEKFHLSPFCFGVDAHGPRERLLHRANGCIANPNRTVRSIGGLQVKYLLQFGQTTPPLQPLDVIYAGVRGIHGGPHRIDHHVRSAG